MILGVAFYYQANLYPDSKRLWQSEWSKWPFWKVLAIPYWQIYTELDLENIYGKVHINVRESIDYI